MRTFVVTLGLLYGQAAWAHSGGTDANGCHTDSSTGVYHCHTPQGGGGELSPGGKAAMWSLFGVAVVTGTVVGLCVLSEPNPCVRKHPRPVRADAYVGSDGGGVVISGSWPRATARQIPTGTRVAVLGLTEGDRYYDSLDSIVGRQCYVDTGGLVVSLRVGDDRWYAGSVIACEDDRRAYTFDSAAIGVQPAP